MYLYIWQIHLISNKWGAWKSTSWKLSILEELLLAWDLNIKQKVSLSAEAEKLRTIKEGPMSIYSLADWSSPICCVMCSDRNHYIEKEKIKFCLLLFHLFFVWLTFLDIYCAVTERHQTTYCQTIASIWSADNSVSRRKKNLFFLKCFYSYLPFIAIGWYSLAGWLSQIFCVMCSDRQAPDNILPHHCFHLVCW